MITIMKQIIHILSFFLFLSCTENRIPNNVITVTIEPYRYVTEAIAGDEWQVRTLFPKGTNPETTEPSPQQMVALANSRIYMLVGGLGFENVWREKIVSMYPSLIIADTSNGIERCGGDPHVWTSPDNMAVIAENICSTLCRADSVNSTHYISRLQYFKHKLSNIDSRLSNLLCNSKGKAFVIFHPSLTYFSNLYSLQQIAIEHEGKEPSVAHIRAVIDSARVKKVDVVLVQEEFDRKRAEVIANEIGATVVEVDPLSYNWEQQMFHIADCISKVR